MPAASLSSDVTLVLVDGGAIASNHRVRKHVWLSLPLVRRLAGEPLADGFAAADLTVASNYEGLFADPTQLRREGPIAAEPLATWEAALDYLRARFIVVDDPEAYGRFLAVRQSLFDRKHLGTFHQQLGAELMVARRESPETWWNEQKFDMATGALRDGAYKYVEMPCLQAYLSSVELAGKTVLDFGCGTGMASQLFLDAGATVIGADPNEERLAVAATRLGPRFRALRLRLEHTDPLAELPDGLDFVWMSDVLLFYFYPLDGKTRRLGAGALLGALKRKMRPGARLALLEPHGVFWLAARHGSADRPFTVLTEYAHKLFGVCPGLGELSAAVSEAGLTITRIEEAFPDEAWRALDPRGYAFAREFPQWWLFELAVPG